jgi:hypothetical protein
MVLSLHPTSLDEAKSVGTDAVSLVSLKRAFSAFFLTLFCLDILMGLSLAQSSSPKVAPPPTPAGFAPFAGAVLSEWKGSVQVQLPNAPAGRPVRGQVLPAGTILDTREGHMMLVMRSDESEILVQPHTRLTLEAPQPGNWDTLQILLGRVRSYIRKRTGGAPPFQMATPSAVIAVRGTRFDVEVNKTGVTEVDVFDGLVEVGSATGAGRSVLVGPGMSTRVSVGGAPEGPVPTREIRPDVEVPDRMARMEFSREMALQADRPSSAEPGGRPESPMGGDATVGEGDHTTQKPEDHNH